MIRTVAVVGAGTMGAGIAQVCALSGFTTLLFDTREEQVAAALRTIDKNLLSAIEKGKLTEQKRTETRNRVSAVRMLTDLKADLIIEAAVENLEVKQSLFAELEKINNYNSILATNTSSISVTAIAAALKDPGRCIGLHFFNPADRMRLVEVIPGKLTAQDIVSEINSFSRQLGKTIVTAKDSPGFIVNRIARHFYGESLKLLEEEVAGVSSIDTLLRSAGFKMGPFELMDLIGVETNLSVTKSVYEGFKRNPKFKPSTIQQKLVDEGHFGRKSGRGFYDYSRK